MLLMALTSLVPIPQWLLKTENLARRGTEGRRASEDADASTRGSRLVGRSAA